MTEAFKRISHPDYPLIEEMVAYFVGGGLRDRYLGLIANDFDYSVVGETPESMLEAGFTVVGKDFPVFHHPITKDEFALARFEDLDEDGFSFITKGVPIELELRRRDFTINAMAMGKDGVLIDPYGGKKDLENKIIRHTSEKFPEDPTRVLRLARFSAKFPDFTIADETIEIAISLREEMKTLNYERVFKELEKALKTDNPSLFFRTLLRVNALDIVFPEIYAMIGKEQKHEHHAEGDVFEHTMRVLDMVCEITADPRVRYAAMYHDIGKPIAFEALESYFGHESDEIINPAFDNLLERRHSGKYVELARKCSKYHHIVHSFHKLNETSAVKILQRKCFPRKGYEFEALLQVCKADEKGRASGYRKLTKEENDILFNGGQIEGFTVAKRKMDYSHLIEVFEEVNKKVEIPKHIMKKPGHKIGRYVYRQKLKAVSKIKWRIKMKDKMQINLETAIKIIDWAGGGNVGVSSNTILYAITGKSVYSKSRDVPYDGADLRRCIELLEDIPELKEHLHMVAEEYPIWIPFVREWDTLVDMYYEDFASLRELIQKLIKEGRELVA